MSDPILALNAPAKESFLCVTMQYGDPTSPNFVYYTNRSEPYGSFLPMPELEVTLPPSTAQIQDDIATLLFASNDFTDRISDGLPTSPIQIRIEEIILPKEIGEAANHLVLFVGKVTSTLKNRGGRAGSRGVKARSWRSFLDVRMGYMVDAQCPFVFNGKGCNQGDGPIGTKQQGAVISDIDGKKITLSTNIDHDTDHHYRSGYVSLNGINIDIREFDATIDDKILYLTRQPPNDWLGATVQVFAGCDKSLSRCREWDNEDNNGAVGVGIPAFNPIFQEPPTG